MRGAVAPTAGLMASAVREIKGLLRGRRRGRHAGRRRHRRTGVPVRDAAPGLTVRGRQQRMLDARRSSPPTRSCCSPRPPPWSTGSTRTSSRRSSPGSGKTRSSRWSTSGSTPWDPISVEAVNADQRRTVQPASAQLHRPADPARRPGLLRHHPQLQRLSHVLLPDVQRRQCHAEPARRLHQGPRVDGRLDRDGPSPASAPTKWPRVWPKATEFGFDNELAAFGLQFGHGLGLGLHERPIISRLNSMTSRSS